MGGLTPLRSAAKQGRRQEPCTIHFTLRQSRPRFPAAVLLRLKRSRAQTAKHPKGRSGSLLTLQFRAFARPIYNYLLVPKVSIVRCSRRAPRGGCRREGSAAALQIRPQAGATPIAPPASRICSVPEIAALGYLFRPIQWLFFLIVRDEPMLLRCPGRTLARRVHS